MANTDLTHRIRRIYAAIDAVEERDLSKLVAKLINSGQVIGFYQNFSGGLRDEDLANIAHSLIHNIANLQDHLRRWAAHNGRDKTKVDDAFKNSPVLQVIKDLSNNDKHGYLPRGGGHSGNAPQIVKIRRQLQMTTKAEKGASVTVTLDPRGVPQVSGLGTAKAIITADIMDRNGNLIGDLYEVALQAIQSWEQVAKDFGVPL
jgi:hypothetical protein